ncbi:MAG: MarR family transcriptional regulator [Acidocella sp.]|nr:MarR family transcriptional regulator [Acidocella sp.]
MPPAKPSLPDLTERPGQVESSGGIDMGILPSLMGYMLRQGQLCVYQDFFHILATENIRPPQLSILEVVSRNPGIRPSDVAEAIGIKRANLVPLVTALEKRGFLTRAMAEADRRAQSLHVTPEGAEKLQYWLSIVRPHEDRLAERLGAHGRETLLKLLQTLVRG